MKITENNSYRYIDHSQRLKMNKKTAFRTSQKSICPKLNPKYSFDTPKLFVRISQTFVRVLSEKKHSRTKSDVFRTKQPQFCPKIKKLTLILKIIHENKYNKGLSILTPPKSHLFSDKIKNVSDKISDKFFLVSTLFLCYTRPIIKERN